MAYFVTGATGFIGRRLIERLLERKGKIHVLVREDSLGRLYELIERLAHLHRIVTRDPWPSARRSGLIASVSYLQYCVSY